MKKIIFVFALISLLMSACKVLSTNLPEKPKEIKINWKRSGGMMWFSESILITNDSCEYNIDREGAKQYAKFKLDASQLDELYKVFYENNFDKIETHKEEVHDRGGTSISLDVDKESFSISNSGMSIVEEGNISNYNEVENAIMKYTFEEVDKQKRNVSIVLDSSISESKYNVILYINGTAVYNEKKEGDYITVNELLFTMNNKFEIYFMQQDGNHSYDKMIISPEYLLEELPINGEIFITLVNDELIIK